MSNLKKIRSRLLPPSSKYFGEEMRHLKKNNASSSDRLNSIETTISVLPQNFDFLSRRLDELFEQNKSLQQKIDTLEAKLDIYANQLYRRNSESNFESRKRLFKSIPEATGNKRLYQLGNTVLLSKLSDFCEKNNLDYWLWCGTLIGAVARNSAIPWDDDIDICMMRKDFLKLRNIVNKNTDYQITTTYDYRAKNKQYRFISKNENIFNFIDIVVCDNATNSDIFTEKKYKKLKQDFIDRIENDETFSYWRDSWMIHEAKSYQDKKPREETKKDEETALKVEETFNSLICSAYESKILTNDDSSECIAYGLDNLFDAPKRKNLWKRNIIFPTHMIRFENIETRIPRDESAFCGICFQGWPYIPNDILNHSHFDEQLFDNPSIVDALQKFVAQ